MNWTELFDSGGAKRVTPTDTKKRAYVITKAQRTAIQRTLKLQGKPIDKADIGVYAEPSRRQDTFGPRTVRL